MTGCARTLWCKGQAAVYLAVAAKSNAGYNAYNKARAFVKTDKRREVPVHLRNAPTKLMKELGYGHEYRYAHDEPTPTPPEKATCPTA